MSSSSSAKRAKLTARKTARKPDPRLPRWEAQLRPCMMAIFDSIAERHKKLAKIQDTRIAAIVKATQLPRATERRYDKLKDEVVESLGKVKFNNTRYRAPRRAALRIEPPPCRRRRAGCCGLPRLPASSAPISSSITWGDEWSGDWLERAGKLPGRGWPKLVDKHVDDVARHRAAIAQIAGEAKLPIAEFRRVVQTVQRGEREAAARKRRWSRPTSGSSSRSPRNTPTAACNSPRSDPGRQYRPDESGR